MAVDALSWQPGAQISLDVSLYLPNSIIQKLAPKIIVEQVCLLVTAERAFDADGIHRFPSHERMSSYVTPTGLAVEGGVQGAVTRRFGGRYQTPLDEFLTVPLEAPPTASDERRIVFRLLPTVRRGATGHLPAASRFRRCRQRQKLLPGRTGFRPAAGGFRHAR